MGGVMTAVLRPIAASATGISCLFVVAALATAPRLRRLARLAPEGL